ncbi:MAG: PspA/IM30 family protein [Planctomycetes bacterium]|nr:PspA/IM30 family protein [Planctomycetota bacterium]
MGIFSRIGNIMTAGVNDILDKAEDPEKMVNQMIRNMENSVTELEESTASALAAAKLAMRKYDKAVQEKGEWQTRAEQALASGNEDLARKALMKKNSIEKNVSIFEKQAADANKLANRMKEEYQTVKEQLAEARDKAGHLINQKKAAESRKKINEDSNKFNSSLNSVKGAFSTMNNADEMFAKMEEKIDKDLVAIEAREELQEDSIEKEFAELTKKTAIDDELEALKAKVK